MAGEISGNLPPNKSTSIGVRRQIKFVQEPEARILPDKREDDLNTLPTLEQNIRASEVFIKAIRNPDLYSRHPFVPEDIINKNLGFVISGRNVENGWFNTESVVQNAKTRYGLPLAIYSDHNHAHLVVKGPYQIKDKRLTIKKNKYIKENGRLNYKGTRIGDCKIEVYDPYKKGFREVDQEIRNGIINGVQVNELAEQKMLKNDYDLMKLINAPELKQYRELLDELKAFSYQNRGDGSNCVPYCLFVSALLHGLESGRTPFKEWGIKQFEQDFGVRIMTREEITGEKILSRVKIRPDIKVE